MKDDQAIIAEVLAGDTEAFGQIVSRYEEMVATIVRNMIAQEDAARDVGQEVFIRLFRSLDKFEGKSKLSTYIGRIAINLSLNELKRQKNKKHEDIDSILQIRDDRGEEQLTQSEFREWIALALKNIPAKYRAVLVLRMIEGYSTKETGEMLAIPDGTVLSRLARAQDRLKKELQKLGYVHNA